MGLVLLLIGATTVFAELRDALDRIWRAPARDRSSGIWGLVRARRLSFGMILGIAFLLMISLVFSTAIAALGKWWSGAFVGWELLAPAPAKAGRNAACPVVSMHTIDKSLTLNKRYRLLREQLHAAYNAAAWDSTTIDRIAGELMSVEQALALGGAFAPPPFKPAGVHPPVGRATESRTPIWSDR